MLLLDYCRKIYGKCVIQGKAEAVSEAAGKLEVSKMSVSRCFDEIEYLNGDFTISLRLYHTKDTAII